MADRSLPVAQLRLEWVYGFRGNQCRNNLFYTASGKLAFFVAGVAVVQAADAQSQAFFLGHTDDILSMAMHPDQRLIASGDIGKKPVVCVWDSETLETKSLLKDGHTSGINCISFSPDGKVRAVYPSTCDADPTSSACCRWARTTTTS